MWATCWATTLSLSAMIETRCPPLSSVAPHTHTDCKSELVNCAKYPDSFDLRVTLWLNNIRVDKKPFLCRLQAPALMQKGSPVFISTLWPPCDSSEDCYNHWWQTRLLCIACTGCHPRLWLGTFWKCQSHMIMNIKQPCIVHDYLTGGGDLTDAAVWNLIVSQNDAWGYWGS